MRAFLGALILAILTSGAAAQPPATTKAPLVAKRGAGDFPALDLFEAVKRAQEKAAMRKIDLSRHYLQAAIYNISTRTWKISYQQPNVKGGYIEFLVREDGRIDVGFGE